jgi:two-component system, OmpR family, response regulator
VAESKGYRILAVDDTPDNLFLLQTFLEAEGFEVETADSGKSALAKLNQVQPDLVLLDVMMPDMNGFEVTQEIRARNRTQTLPILLISAHDEHRLQKGLAIGANDYIQKPINFDQLLSRIAALTT